MAEAPLALKALAASGAAVASAFIVNPFDVVKTKIQQVAALERIPTSYTRQMALAGECAPNCPKHVTPKAVCAPECYFFDGSFRMLCNIVRKEGATALWRGTSHTLVMAVPTVALYMPLYGALHERIVDAGAPAAAPLFAGALSRGVAVLALGPVELARTRVLAGSISRTTTISAALLAVIEERQPHHQPHLLPSAASTSGAAAAAAAASAGGGGGGGAIAAATSAAAAAPSRLRAEWDRVRLLRHLWLGVGAQLARDVPFSAIYWSMVEPIRRAMLIVSPDPDEPSAVLSANVTAGGFAGMLAAGVTTPLDVVKTRRQLLFRTEPQLGLLQTLSDVAREGGFKALFSGVGPRALRAAPACGITLACYEGVLHWHRAQLLSVGDPHCFDLR